MPGNMQDAPPPVTIEQPAEAGAAVNAETVTEDGRIIIDLVPKGADSEQCEPAANNEIVVCGEPDDPMRYRYDPNLEAGPNDGMPKAEIELAEGVNAAAETEQADVGGFPSNRIMTRIKIKF